VLASEAARLLTSSSPVTKTLARGQRADYHPLDDLIAEHDEFKDMVRPCGMRSLTTASLGYTPGCRSTPAFLQQTLLRDLGWSDEEIESLPARIESGEFTFEDMLAAATEAVDTGASKKVMDSGIVPQTALISCISTMNGGESSMMRAPSI